MTTTTTPAIGDTVTAQNPGGLEVTGTLVGWEGPLAMVEWFGPWMFEGRRRHVGRFTRVTAATPEPEPETVTEEPAIRVEHTRDGTLVHGTTRDDREAVDALKASGFKWSRNLGAWYLPRTWSPETRELRVRQLETRLGGRITVERSDAPARSAAERDAETRERAAARAERLEARAERRQAEADTARQTADTIAGLIPMGQPILVGHHSQRRHERDLERIDRGMRQSWEKSAEADADRESADRARRTAAGRESKVTIGNRIDRNEAELRKLQRENRAHSRQAELRDRIQHDRGKLEAAGGVAYGRDNVTKGDFVKVRGTWYPVVRANVKTVSVPWWGGGLESTATDSRPWREVQDHRKASEVTDNDLEAWARAVARPFPGLAEKIRARKSDAV